MSSLAQEESRSISENTTWGKRKQFAEGKTSVGYSAFLGYDKDFKINEEQAKVVKLIYKLFLGGRSFYAITKELEKRGIKSPTGKDKWCATTVRSILSNEKYRGDALIQKQYTADFLDKTRRKNTGEIPQYYVEEHHEAIIPPGLFDYVQAELTRREKLGRYNGMSLFSNRIECGCCGGWYGAKVWHSTDKYRKVIYQCNHKYKKGRKNCTTPNLTEEEIKEAFTRALGALLEMKEEVAAELQVMIDTVCQTEGLLEEKTALEKEMEMLHTHIMSAIQENAKVAQNQDEYREKEEWLRAAYGEKHARLLALENEIKAKQDRREILQYFKQQLPGMEDATAFDEELWGGLLDRLLVKEDGQIVVIFKGGIAIAAEGRRLKKKESLHSDLPQKVRFAKSNFWGQVTSESLLLRFYWLHIRSDKFFSLFKTTSLKYGQAL